MSVLTQANPIVYPDSDGQPLADNTLAALTTGASKRMSNSHRSVP